MRSVYKVLAYLVAVEVMVQASMIAFAVAGLGVWVDGGGVLDKAAFESDDTTFTGIVGFMVHGINGMMVIPLIALILLIVSFFAKVPHGVRNAGIVLLLVALQVTLGIFGHETPYAGMFHGLNALILFATALYTARNAATATVADVTYQGEAAGV